jgi:hypothetical protein
MMTLVPEGCVLLAVLIATIVVAVPVENSQVEYEYVDIIPDEDDDSLLSLSAIQNTANNSETTGNEEFVSLSVINAPVFSCRCPENYSYYNGRCRRVIKHGELKNAH